MTHFEVLLNFSDNGTSFFHYHVIDRAIFSVVTRDNSGNFALSQEVFYYHSDKKKPEARTGDLLDSLVFTGFPP